MREKDFYKRPGISETLDWVIALMALGREELNAATVKETLGCVFKYYEDLKQVEEMGVDHLLSQLPAWDDLTCAPVSRA